MELIVAFFFYLRNTKVYIEIKLVDKAKKRKRNQNYKQDRINVLG
jgi:hypothetical protein